ncbi:amyloid-beta A4 precursor protein-binding family A member 1-like [Scyliorhinus canicula]|uniref:amyloid-beta A4 precursor protein-binding family A member 1-like n=1 Tax=Scyliorhinus canicula TaxID=7830 RepID=UPI0018F569D1|nr:amyloid-beta A4 precursor protein-binding family A member 1-like [Scyliorhinus canicula]
MNRQEDLTEVNDPLLTSSQSINGVTMDDQELENEDEVNVETVLIEVGRRGSQENLQGSWNANGEDVEEDFYVEHCVFVSDDVNGDDNHPANMELDKAMTEGGSASVDAVHLCPPNLNADSANNLIEKDFSSGTDNTEESSDFQENEDDDHCQIKLLLTQLRFYEQDGGNFDGKTKLASQPMFDGHSLESNSKFTTDVGTDSLPDDDRQLFVMVNHQDDLTEMTHKPLMSTEIPRSLNRNEIKYLVHQGNEQIQVSCLDSKSGANDHVVCSDEVTGVFNHPSEGSDEKHKTSRDTCSWPETSSENEFGQSEGNIKEMLRDQQSPDFNPGKDGTIEDDSSLYLQDGPLFRLKKDWRKEGEALSLALKELKEEVDNISKSFLPDDGVEHIDPVKGGACRTESSIYEHDRQPKKTFGYPAFKEVSGPCESEDLLDGIIFVASYLGSTQLFSDKNPSTNVRMSQAQEAVGRIKAPEGESQPMTAVDLFISTQRIKVLNAETQETLMDHPLQTISYIADIGTTIVFMARRRLPRKSPDQETGNSPAGKREYKMICHVFESEDASLIAQAIGQAFTVAYQQFLNANGINPSDLSPNEYNDLLDTEFYNGDLVHFSKSENSKEVHIEKAKGEILGLVIVESGWGSILPTVVIANLMHGGPTERSGELNIGDQIISVNGTSLVGLPLATCQGIIKDLKHQSEVKLNIVRCPPVTTAIIKRPDQKHQLGFSVQDGIIYSLMRGGIAERGGIRVGHRIIEINGQSVVATPHEKIVQRLSNAIGEIHIKTMPAATYRLLTGQEQPIYI